VIYHVPDGLNDLNEQQLIAERLGVSDEGLVSRDRGAIREKIETEPKTRN